MIRRYFKLLFTFILILTNFVIFGQTPEDYLSVLKKTGVKPIEFVQQKLKTYDLIIFDDALHNAVEPFEFYQELIKKNKGNFQFVFIEVFGINCQTLIDSFLSNSNKDKMILLKVFQDSFNGTGWRYKTYYELLSAVWDYNNSVNDVSEKIKVFAVDQPIYWKGIHSRKDYEVFQNSLIGRDYFMYKTILNTMNCFSEKRKGIFLTNTRHAYKNIRNSNENLYWNCGTFFHQWHPGKTYSVRIHNVTLNIERILSKSKSHSIEGLDQVKYSWVKMENGLWDDAFALNSNTPVAISLGNNCFGQASYIGNHMLNVKDGQTMYDAYDALIFLASLDNLHFSAQIDFIYTESYKKELMRRIKIIYNNDLEDLFERNNVKSIEEYIEKITIYKPKKKNTFVLN